MKKIHITVILLAVSMGLKAQGNEIDAYTLSTPELNGTSRSMAMAGAFGALGGDISVISSNPAGLGIYRSSETAGTFDVSMVSTATNWLGVKTEMNKNRYTFNNVGVELYFPTNAENHWNIAFSYNRLKNFNRRYRMRNNGQDYSMADYAAWRASNAFSNGWITKDELTLVSGEYDPYNNRNLSGQWLPILGYEAGYFDNFIKNSNSYQSAFGYGNEAGTEWSCVSPNQQSLMINEDGNIDEYNIGFGTNISNVLFLGASLTMTDINYRYHSFYEEFFPYNQPVSKDDHLTLENWLTTEGSAVSLNLGAIVNLQSVRLGVAYHTPRWYNLTDYYDAEAGTYINGYNPPEMINNTPANSYSEYHFRSPAKWIFSGAFLLGRTAMFSVDYELMNYRQMRYSDTDGDDMAFEMTNYDFIDKDYKASHTIKAGGEVKITPQFAIRGGYMWQSSPMRSALANNDVEVFPAGTIPHFTVSSNATNYYTAGLGYRFSPNVYIDAACVYRYNKADAYAFSNTFYNDPVYSKPASLVTASTRIVITLGHKF